MKQLAVLIVVLMALSLIPSFALAADKDGSMKVGETKGISKNTKIVYDGKTIDGKAQYTATIDLAPQYLDDLITPIDCSWHTTGKTWVVQNNLFDATVDATQVTVAYQGAVMTWDPVITIGKVLSSPVSPSPVLLAVDPINGNYYGNTLQWQYDGFTRNLRLIEGMLIEYYTIDKLPKGDIVIDSCIMKDAWYSYNRPTTVYDADGKRLASTDNKGIITLTVDTMKDAKFPVTIDPDSTFYSTASDGYLSSVYFETTPAVSWDNAHDATTANGGIYDTGTWAEVWIYTYYPSPSYFTVLWRPYLYFDTSSLPDDLVFTSALLKLYVSAYGTGLGSTDYIIQGGMPTYPHVPLEVGDYLYSYYSGDYGQLNSASITSGYNTWNLTAAGIAALNTTGLTKFILREEAHDVNDVMPSYSGLQNYVRFYTYEQGVGYRPQLVVTYVADPPIMTTIDASAISTSTARLNSVVSDDGGGVVTTRFGWGETSQPAIEDYDHYATVAGTYTTGQYPYLDIEDLGSNTTYYFRVEGTNAYGTALGGEESFTTELSFSEPSNFLGYPYSTSISLSWDKGAGTSQTLVRWSVSTYPTGTTDGTLLYLGSDMSYSHTGLVPGKTYYYSAWGESAGNYTGNYTTLIMTTSASSGAGVIPTPTEPTRWLSAPDYTNMANLWVVYDIVNGVADSLEIPKPTFWMSLAIFLSMFFGFGLYLWSHKKFMIGAIALVAAMFFGYAVRLIPFWIPLTTLILLIALKMGHKEVTE